MATKTRYTTAAGISPEALDKSVGRLLGEGFRLYGDPYAASRADEVFFCQALIGEDSESMGEQLQRAQAVERPTSVLPVELERPITALPADLPGPATSR